MYDAVDVLPAAVNSWNDESGGQRAKNQRKQNFAITHRETGFHVVCNHTFIEKGGVSPRHHHNFEQVRYVLEGHLTYSKKLYGPGTLIYVPESVYYGPQTRDEDTRILVFKFPGPSGVPMFTAAELKRGRDELRAEGITFQKGLAHFPSGKKKDGFEAMWERVSGRPIEYAPRRYEEPIYVHPKAFQWRPTATPGVSVKHLGYFNECGPNVNLLRVEPGATIPPGNVGWLEMRLVVEGEVEYADQSCPAISRIYCPPGVPYEETSNRSGATLLVFQIAVPGGEAPRR